MLKLEVFVFIRSHPQLSANLFEELEKAEPYIEILETSKGVAVTDKPGWIIVFRGKLKSPDGQTLGPGDICYQGAKGNCEPLEPSIIVFLSEDSMENFIREEPELAIPIAEVMRKIKGSV